MSGTNPYLANTTISLPQQKYRIRFLPQDITVEVDPQALPQGKDGLPGAILSLALTQGVHLDHSCGGVCACSTCHVWVKQGLDSCNEASEDEEDMLDLAPGLQPVSRLACQCVPNGTKELVVEIPPWNRNLITESH